MSGLYHDLSVCSLFAIFEKMEDKKGQQGQDQAAQPPKATAMIYICGGKYFMCTSSKFAREHETV